MIRRYGPALVFLLGVALGAALAVKAGLEPIGEALARIGWTGLVEVSLLQVVALLLCAAAWRAVSGEISFAATAAARWIRDGASNLAGFIPAIGEAISSRALSLIGRTGGKEAAASTIVDVAAEQLALGIYSLIGLMLLLPYLGVAQTGRWTLIVAVASIPVVGVYFLSRHPGTLHLAERLAYKLMGRTPEPGHVSLAEAVEGIYARRGRAAAAVALHLVAWAAGAVQVWVAARLLGTHISFGDCVALESLVYAARGAAFIVPMAAGVQEGGFLLVGKVLGLDPTQAMALSLILRARDVVVGAPGVLLWYAAEARHAARRRRSGGAKTSDAAV
jgi:putative membrane protein